MQIKSYSRHYTNGNSARITVTTVREDPVTHIESTDCPEKIYEFWQTVIATQPDHEPEKETLVVVLFNTKYHPYAWHRVSIGSLTEAMAHPREIFRPVIVGAAYAFCIMHNHPSGDPMPSNMDCQLTRRIKDCAELFQIRLVDHVIIGTPHP